MSMVQTDLLAYVVHGLRTLGPKRWPEVAEATGKSIPTLRKLAYRDRTNPELSTIEPIANWLRENLQ